MAECQRGRELLQGLQRSDFLPAYDEDGVRVGIIYYYSIIIITIINITIIIIIAISITRNRRFTS